MPKISQLPEQLTSASVDPAQAYLPIVINGVTEKISLQVISDLIGGRTTGVNVGTGAGIFLQKVGTDLQFKTLTSGSNNISIIQNANDIKLDLAITFQNVGGGAQIYSGST